MRHLARRKPRLKTAHLLWLRRLVRCLLLLGQPAEPAEQVEQVEQVDQADQAEQVEQVEQVDSESRDKHQPRETYRQLRPLLMLCWACRRVEESPRGRRPLGAGAAAREEVGVVRP